MEDVVTDMKALLVWRVNVFFICSALLQMDRVLLQHKKKPPGTVGNDFHTGNKM